MILLEKYLRREPLTREEMIDLMPVTRAGMRVEQTEHGLIEINWKDPENGHDCITFTDDEVITANTEDVYLVTEEDELPF